MKQLILTDNENGILFAVLARLKEYFRYDKNTGCYVFDGILVVCDKDINGFDAALNKLKDLNLETRLL